MYRAWTALAVTSLLAGAVTAGEVRDLRGKPVNLFADTSRIKVLLFVRTDCPITDRYAPELRRIAAEFTQARVAFWLVYPGKIETAGHIEEHVRQFAFPGTPVLDGDAVLMNRAQATVSPEAAVFSAKGALLYRGRIDNRWVSFGKSRPSATTHDLQGAIEAALEGKAPAERVTRAIGCSLQDVR